MERFENPVFRLGFARTVTHYWGNGHFLGEGNDEGVVLRDAPLLKDVPGTLVQGSLDLGNLLGTVATAPRLARQRVGRRRRDRTRDGHAGDDGGAGGGDGPVRPPAAEPC
ncbi:hypothetical protein GCM10010389_02500 [Streptomyces echinoruber]|uniref:Uncharacterized protein n=1 Tax=Streptomyces echinoruber TaxID=68898 RepID=A0A918V3Z4_9ACTN|nr:hypothetical protein GCM10010389_02500 [Streptomyces echinoruber]